MDVLLGKVNDYLNGLDWNYIITFLVICYLLTKDSFITSWWKLTKESSVINKVRSFVLSIPKGMRVMIMGMVYAVFLYRLRDYDKSHIEGLMQSFLFVTAFYGLILAKLVKRLESLGVEKVEKNSDMSNLS